MHGRVLVLWLSVLLVAACASRGDSGEGSDGAAAPGLLPSVQVTTAGDAVRFVLQVTNTTESPIELEFPSGQSFDFVVLDGSREVWRWSADRMFTQALRSETLAPGETLTYEAEWTPPAGVAGEHTVVARLTASNRPVEQRAQFRVD